MAAQNPLLQTAAKPKKSYSLKHLVLGLAVLLLFLIISGYFSQNKSSLTDQNNQPETKIQTVAQNKQQAIQKYTGKIQSLADFTNSPFCKDYVCKEEDSWTLNNGGINHSYASIPLGGDKHNYFAVEISTVNNKTTEFGIMFFGREESGMTQSDLEIAYKFIESIDSTQDASSLKNYISRNVEKDINQIYEATPLSWGSFVVYAGKIGQQTISINSK